MYLLCRVSYYKVRLRFLFDLSELSLCRPLLRRLTVGSVAGVDFFWSVHLFTVVASGLSPGFCGLASSASVLSAGCITGIAVCRLS